MRILPVLDLKGGQVVRGLAGRRQEYQPIRSRLTPSCQPLAVVAVVAPYDWTSYVNSTHVPPDGSVSHVAKARSNMALSSVAPIRFRCAPGTTFN